MQVGSLCLVKPYDFCLQYYVIIKKYKQNVHHIAPEKIFGGKNVKRVQYSISNNLLVTNEHVLSKLNKGCSYRLSYWERDTGPLLFLCCAGRDR